MSFKIDGSVKAGIPNGYFIMSNGDHLVIYISGTSIKYRYSTDSGVTWAAAASVSGSSVDITVDATDPAPIRVCASKSSANTLYLAWLNNSGNLRGYTLSYNTGTHALTGSGGSTNMGSASNVWDIYHDGSSKTHILYPNSAGTGLIIAAFTASTFGGASSSFTKTIDSSNPGGVDSSIQSSPTATLLVSYVTGTYGSSSLKFIDYTVSSLYTQSATNSISGASLAFTANDKDGYTDVLYATVSEVWIPDDPQPPGGSGFGHYSPQISGVFYVKRKSASNVSTPYAFGYSSGDPLWGAVGTILDASQYRTLFARATTSGWTAFKLTTLAPTPVSIGDGAWTTGGNLTIPTSIRLARKSLYGGFPSGTSANALIVASVYSKTGGSYNIGVWVDSVDSNVGPTTSNLTPIDGAETFDPATETIPLTWAYTDTDDSPVQLKFEVQVQEAVAGATVYYITSGGAKNTSEQIITSSTQARSINSGQLSGSLYGYQWRVRAQDVHGKWGGWSSWTKFFANGKPTASISTITSPVTSNRPTITWTYTDPEATDSSAYRLKLYDASGNQLWDSGVIADSVTSGSTQSGQIGYTLAQDTIYSVGVLVADGDGYWSNEVQSRFWSFATLPAQPTISVVRSDTAATVTVTAGTPTGSQSTPVSVSLFRWSSRLSKYIAVATSSTSPSMTVTDYGAPINADFYYKAVTTGDNASQIDTLSDTQNFDEDDWRLISDTTGDTVVLEVQQFDATPQMQAEMLEPMGRTRQVAVTFTLRGNEGTVTAFVDASNRNTDMPVIYGMSAQHNEVFLKSPYGEVFRVMLGTPSQQLQSGGHATVTIPYIEVDDA